MTPDRNEVLLGTLATLSIVSLLVLIFALRKVVSFTVSVGMLLFYELAEIVMYVNMALHIVDVVSIPLLWSVDDTKDSPECTVHGVLYMYIMLYYYVTTTLLAVESFVCLVLANLSLRHQKNKVSRRRVVYILSLIHI